MNRKYYVGSSKNIRQRLLSHLSSLKKKKHANAYLQHAWNNDFSYGIIAECSEEDRVKIEFQWIKGLDAANTKKGYNLVDNEYSNENRTKASWLVKNIDRFPVMASDLYALTREYYRTPRDIFFSSFSGTRVGSTSSKPAFVRRIHQLIVASTKICKKVQCECTAEEQYRINSFCYSDNQHYATFNIEAVSDHVKNNKWSQHYKNKRSLVFQWLWVTIINCLGTSFLREIYDEYIALCADNNSNPMLFCAIDCNETEDGSYDYINDCFDRIGIIPPLFKYTV